MQPLGVSRRCIDVLAPSVPKRAWLGVLVSFGTVQWSPMTLPLSPRMTTPAGKCRTILATLPRSTGHSVSTAGLSGEWAVSTITSGE